MVFRYTEPAPNGALRDIAGVSSADGRVVGLMPHPEHAIDALTGPGTDGLGLFTSVSGEDHGSSVTRSSHRSA